ncbi:hypothetical protein [Vibrio tapetis]
MRDSLLIFTTLLAALLVVFLFIGIGLTPDNYQYFLSRRLPKVLAIVIAAVAIAQSSLVCELLAAKAASF